MAVFSFRHSRIETTLQIWLRLQDSISGQPLPCRTKATIVDFSVQGACLTVANLLIDNTHLFYSTLDSDRYTLLLQTEDNDDQWHFTISGRPVWMDSCTFNGKPAFKIGIRFLQKQKEVYARIKKAKVL